MEVSQTNPLSKEQTSSLDQTIEFLHSELSQAGQISQQSFQNVATRLNQLNLTFETVEQYLGQKDFSPEQIQQIKQACEQINASTPYRSNMKLATAVILTVIVIVIISRLLPTVESPINECIEDCFEDNSDFLYTCHTYCLELARRGSL